MSDFGIKDIFETFQNRVKSPLFGSVALSFIAFNWRELFNLFFSKTATVTERIAYFDTNTGLLHLLVYPVIVGTGLAIALPFLNFWVARAIAWPSTQTHLLGDRKASASLAEKEKLTRQRASLQAAENAEDKQKLKQVENERARQEEERITAAKRREDELIAQAQRDQDVLKIENKEIRAKLQNALEANRKEVEPIPPLDPEVQKQAEAKAETFLKQNKAVPDDVALNVRDLDLDRSDFTDAGLLTKCIWLQSLSANGTKLVKISPLGKLHHLQSLNLSDTQITDIGGLAKLVNLQRLYLRGAQVTDIGVLAKLVNLQRLILNDTQVTDIGVLAKLVNLQRLYLNDTQITDIGVLAKLVNLQWLYLNDTQITDIGVLAELVNLQRLGLNGTQVTDWWPVAHVKDVSGRPDDWDV